MRCNAQPRFAFAAQLWGDAAVVCRAVEGQPGTIVDQQFGMFATWTQAHTFAKKLNEGLEIEPLEVQHIVTSSLLSSDPIVRTGLILDRAMQASLVNRTTRYLQVRFICEELALAVTQCHSARLLSRESRHPSLRLAHRSLLRAWYFMLHFAGDREELKQIETGVDDLSAKLQELSGEKHGQRPLEVPGSSEARA